MMTFIISMFQCLQVTIQKYLNSTIFFHLPLSQPYAPWICTFCPNCVWLSKINSPMLSDITLFGSTFSFNPILAHIPSSSFYSYSSIYICISTSTERCFAEKKVLLSHSLLNTSLPNHTLNFHIHFTARLTLYQFPRLGIYPEEHTIIDQSVVEESLESIIARNIWDHLVDLIG